MIEHGKYGSRRWLATHRVSIPMRQTHDTRIHFYSRSEPYTRTLQPTCYTTFDYLIVAQVAPSM